MSKLSVGIISHDSVQQHLLLEVIKERHCEANAALLIDKIIENTQMLTHPLLDNIDVWLVDIDFSKIENVKALDDFDDWLYSDDKTIIFGEGISFNAAQDGYDSWVRQVKIKLEEAQRNKGFNNEQEFAATHVWVLSASTGGPEAVKEFIDKIPSGLGVAFIYAQHIEPGQDKALLKSITRDSAYHAVQLDDGKKIVSDTLMVVPPDQQFSFLDNGAIQMKSSPWRGSYQPSIDQVVAMVASVFGKNSGAIFFSGLGDDGMAGARLIAKNGGQVWIQSPDSCIADNMPNAIKETGVVTQFGKPTELANFFLRDFNV